MTSIKSIATTTLCCLALFSCTKKPDEKPRDHGTASTRLYPLSSGNSWTYEVTTFDSTGNPTISTYEQKINGMTFIQGDTFYKLSGVNAYYRPVDDGRTLIANSGEQTSTRYQYHKGQDSMQKIGELLIDDYDDEYYSISGTFTYKSYKDCYCFITKASYRGNLTTVVYKYLKRGIGIVGTDIFSYSEDGSGRPVYTLLRSWKLKDYYLYP